MKKMKKLLSMLLAVIMVLAMAAPSFAAEEVGSESAKTGKITIDNPIAEKKYNAYKIFDVTYVKYNDNDKTDIYAYSLDANNQDLYQVISNYVQQENSGLTLTLSGDGSKYIVEITNGLFNAAAFAKYLANVTPETKLGAAIPLLVENGKAEKSGLDLGYYFVKTDSGALCNLTTTDPTAEIHDKNDNPFGKDEDVKSVEIGEIVNYTLLGKVPDTTGYTKYDYIITDKMSGGLTFNANSLNVYYAKEISEEEFKKLSDDEKAKVAPKGGNEKYFKLVSPLGQNDYTLDTKSTNDCTFKLKIEVMNLQDNVTKPLIIKYSATVNEQAVVEISENKAKLTYSNDPADSNSTDFIDDEEKVYSAKIVIDKYAKVDDNDTDKTNKLAGAEFILAKGNGNNRQYYQLVKTGDKLDDGTLAQKTEIKWTSDKTKATTMITGDGLNSTTLGKTEFTGLKNGTYYLIETKAPTGYNILDEEITVEIAEANNETTLESLTYKNEVGNAAGIKLPSTGGIGTTIFYAVGIILMAGAVFFVVRRKRA